MNPRIIIIGTILCFIAGAPKVTSRESRNQLMSAPVTRSQHGKSFSVLTATSTNPPPPDFRSHMTPIPRMGDSNTSTTTEKSLLNAFMRRKMMRARSGLDGIVDGIFGIVESAEKIVRGALRIPFGSNLVSTSSRIMNSIARNFRNSTKESGNGKN